MQSLAVVRTGLEGEQTKMDVISNNLANLNTTGFKKMRPVFADLLYENKTQAGGFTSQATNYPSGLQQGTGANVVATEPVVTQGSLEQTGNALDLAINGQGYFQILQPSGQIAYTRDGSFQVSAQGQLVTAKGYQLQPSITIPRNAQSVTIGTDGTISVQIQGQSQPSQVGVIQLANSSILKAFNIPATIWRFRPRLRALRSPVSLRRMGSAPSPKVISKARMSRWSMK